MKKPTVWAGKSAQAVFVSLRCLLHGIAETGACRFPFISKMEGFLMKRNRWLTALAAVGIHMSIGSVYAWSVLTRPVMETMGLSLSATTWAFSIAILFLGLSAGFLGPLVERLGPSRSGMVSAVFSVRVSLGQRRRFTVSPLSCSISSTEPSGALVLARAISRLSLRL